MQQERTTTDAEMREAESGIPEAVAEYNEANPPDLSTAPTMFTKYDCSTFLRDGFCYEVYRWEVFAVLLLAVILFLLLILLSFGVAKLFD